MIHQMTPYSIIMTLATRKTIGQHIRECRESKELTQEELAYMAGIGRSYLAKVEAGTRNATVDFLEKIAISLETTLESLCRGV